MSSQDDLTRRDFIKTTSVALAVGATGCGDGALPGTDTTGDALGTDVSADAAGDTSGDTVADSLDAAVDTPDATPLDTPADPGVDSGLEIDAVDTSDTADVPGDVADTADVTDATDVSDVEPDVPPEDIFDPAAFDLDTGAFPLGVQSGDASPSTAVLWTRYVGSAPGVTVHVWAATGQVGPFPVTTEVSATPEDHGFVHVTVQGLEAGTIYGFAWTEDTAEPDKRSSVGRFRTAIAEDSNQVVVFGGVSCTKQTFKPYRTLERAAEEDLDFFILGGDTSYNDGAESVSEFRSDWEDAISDDGYQALFASTSIMASWDDHEVDNNWDPETISPSIEQAARQTFFEHLALERVAEDPSRIWRSHRWGTTLEVFVLDTRGERLPSTKNGNNAQYISPEQMTWLKDGLLNSQATFKFVVNSVPITNMPFLYVSAGDRWEGYDAQRDDIVAHSAAIPNVFWLSGDFHFPAIARVDPSGPGNNMFEFFMGPGGNLTNPAWPILLVGNRAPQFEWVAGDNNYTRFTADPVGMTLTVEFVDGDGDVVHDQTFNAQ